MHTGRAAEKMTAPTIGKRQPTRQTPTQAPVPTAGRCPSTTTKNKHKLTFHLRHQFSVPQVFFYAPFIGRKGRERSERGMPGEGRGTLQANQELINSLTTSSR